MIDPLHSGLSDMLIGTSPLPAGDPTPLIISRKRKRGANQKNGDAKDPKKPSNYKEQNPDSNPLQYIKAKMLKIASQETIMSLWYSHRAARSSIYGYDQIDIIDNSHHSGISAGEALILRRLRMLQRCIEKARSVKQFATALERFHMAEVVSLYAEAKAQRKHAGHASQGSLVDQFASIIFPDVVHDSQIKARGITKRKPLKTRFDSFIKKAKPWARFVERYGGGILFLIPEDLTNEE